MGVYDELGLRTVINASGTLTRLGGSRMAPEVLAAMADAAASFVPIDALQARAGEIIADDHRSRGRLRRERGGRWTLVGGRRLRRRDGRGGDGPPAGHVRTEGRGRRPARTPQRLRPRHPRRRGAHGRGWLSRAIPAPEARSPWQIAAAITERTAAVACPILDTPGTVPLPEVCQIAHERGVPVIVDAAAELPPRANLRRFIAEGADLVVFSGGKAIGGPQASGILAGRADLIASVALQHQDMDVRPETWSWRPLLDSGRLAGVPHQGFGRSMKVGREEIVGLITALRRFAAGSDEEDLERWQRRLDPIEQALEGIPRHSRQPPRCRITNRCRHCGSSWRATARATRAYDLVNRLLDGEPAIAVDQSYAEHGRLSINPQGLTAEEATAVARRLREELRG